MTLKGTMILKILLFCENNRQS